MRRPVDLDHRAGRRVHEIDGEQQVLARRVQHRDVALEPGVDRAEHLERRRHRRDERRVAPGLRDALEPDVALLAQPVERPALERDAVLRRRLRERGVRVVGRHPPDRNPVRRWGTTAAARNPFTGSSNEPRWPSVAAATAQPRARLRCTSPPRVLAQEAGREGVAGSGRVDDPRDGLRRARDAATGAERERAGGSARDHEQPVAAVRDALERVDQGCVGDAQPEEPDVELRRPARRERDRVADVVGVREVDGAQAARPAGHHRLEEREALAEGRRREHVAAGDHVALPALTRKPASTPSS